MITVRKTIRLAALALTLAAGLAQAQGYPNRPVKIVVPFASGGPADNYARFMAQRLSDELKQPFVIDNKPGAGSIIGTDFAAKSPADGYTLLMSSGGTVSINPHLYARMPFDPVKDLLPVAAAARADSAGIPDLSRLASSVTTESALIGIARS